MRASTAYFVGAGTIVAALAIGLGGGIVAGNIMDPVTPKLDADAGKVDRRADVATPAVTSSERVQYLAGTQAFGTMAAAPAAAQQVDPDTSVQSRADSKPETPVARFEPADTAPSTAATTSVAAEPVASTPIASSNSAYAKAMDADVKKAAIERRRAERRERWAERRRHAPRDMRARTDWDDVARNVRADADERDVDRRPRGGGPQIMLFGADDD